LSLFISKDSNVYVLCPAYSKTGGPELLHQLVNELTNNGIDAYITYYDIKKNDANYTPDDFKKYITDYKTLIEIEDKKENIVISPEINWAINIIKKVKNAQKIIWWLSVDNFDRTCGLKNTLKTYGLITTPILMLKREMIYNFSNINIFDKHLCQSHYAIKYLEKKGIDNPLYLSDYVNDEYLNIIDYNDKEDIIAYNPKKGQKFTKKIITQAKDLKFVPIQNLTTQQVKELLLKSKVYIDFGNHPGKDRIPREAAMCGCCIITNKRGSARYYEDVPINNEFKFDDTTENIEMIIKKIKDCIENYDNEINKFDNYRQFIKQEKQQFKTDVKQIFEL